MWLRIGWALKADIVSNNKPKPNICENNSNLFCVKSNVTRLLKPNDTQTVIANTPLPNAIQCNPNSNE
jgi:hypothetical protein